MAKKVQGYIKLQVPAGSANPSPPIGPALGQQGVNIMEFCKQFNAQTQKLEKGLPIPVDGHVAGVVGVALPAAAAVSPERLRMLDHLAALGGAAVQRLAPMAPKQD